MFDAIRKLGSYVIESEGLSEENVLIQESKLASAKNVICVVFELRDGSIIYDRTHLEEYDSSKSGKYLYRTFSHGRYDVTPTTRVLSSDKVKIRTLLWFKEYSQKYEDWLIRSLNDEINEKAGEIFADVSREYDALPKEERRNLIFTIKFKEKDEEKYLGDYAVFTRIFKEEALRKFFAKHNVESKGAGICYLCGKGKEVFGFASPFSFYTVDKKGFAPNFIREDAWKRLPVCSECAISLESGKEFLNKYLLKNFYRFKFYVIPKFIFGDINEEVIKDVEDVAGKRKYTESLLCVEDNILDLMEGKEKILHLDFMFIKPKQKDFFDIIQYVEDVSPSWIKKLHEVLNEVKDFSLFKEDLLKKILGKSKVGGLDTDLTIGGLIRPFFPSPSYDKYFIDIIGNILAQRAVNENLLIRAFVREIQNKHVNEKAWEEKILCLKSFMLLLFINRLKLVR
jgi:CRISPR-associated protein Csh1